MQQAELDRRWVEYKANPSTALTSTALTEDELTAETEADLLRGIEWFDRILVGLGEQFESEFYSALERINQDLSVPLFVVAWRDETRATGNSP